MKQVNVWYHKDGDSLQVTELPLWTVPYEWVLNCFCPCCGPTGWLFEKLPSGWLQGKWFSVWSALLDFSITREKNLFSVPVPSGCIAAMAIYGNHDPDLCWHDDCPIEKKREELEAALEHPKASRPEVFRRKATCDDPTCHTTGEHAPH